MSASNSTGIARPSRARSVPSAPAAVDVRQPLQMELLTPTNSKLTKALGLWDRLPVWVLGKDVEPERDASGTTLPIVRDFDVGGVQYQVETLPANITVEGGRRKDVFPGYREQTVERVIRRLAAREQAYAVDSGKLVWVQLTLYEIWAELHATRKTLTYSEIMEALEIMSGSSFRVTRIASPEATEGDLMVKSNIYPNLKVKKAKKSDTIDKLVVNVQMNELIADSIKSLDFHDINYQSLLKYKSVARFVYGSLMYALILDEAEDVRKRVMRASKIIEECALMNKKSRASFKTVTDGIRELEAEGIFTVRIEEVFEKGTGGRPKKTDVIYHLSVSDTFYATAVKAKDGRADTLRQFAVITGGKSPEDGWASRAPKDVTPTLTQATLDLIPND